MTILLKNGTVFTLGGPAKQDLLISPKGVSVFADSEGGSFSADRVVDCTDKMILPGFADVHVHFREPGFSYKETIETGSKAAAKGGYTCVCSMPNLKPAPSTLETLKEQLDIIERDAVIRVIPYGTITMKQDGRSEISDMDALAPYVCAFTDDGCGVQAGVSMKEAMEKAASLGKMIVAHCEDESILGGTSIHDGQYAESIGHKGISSASEWKQVERDVELSRETGCAYHVCHVSTKESVDVIRRAKAAGIDVTCETGPHYLVMSDNDLMGLDPALPENGRFKMNPPIRSREDRDALIEGIKDGTVDMIATDHAPHSYEEKHRGILDSAFGIVGLETAFPVLYTELVLKGVISLEKLIEVMAINPRKRFGLPGLGIDPFDGSVPGTPKEMMLAMASRALIPCSDFAIVDLDREYVIDPGTFASKGRSTPFEGWTVKGEVIMTIMDGRIVYEK